MDTEKQVLNELRIEVSKRLGKEISSSAHCDQLSNEIKKIGFIINPQTFRRFFGFIKNSGKFHIYTLDTLSKYCECTDYAHFKKNLTENELHLFLGNLGTESDELNYWTLSENLCQKISDSPSLLEEFMHLYSQRIRETDLSPEVYVLPAARKFGVLLIQSWIKNDKKGFTDIYNQTLHTRKTYKEVSEKSVCSFEYAVLEHLIFTDKTEEMRFLIENNTFQVHNDREFVPQDRKENHDVCWNIMCVMAYLKMKEYAECIRYLNKVNLEHLSLGWKKHYSILYYFVKHEFADTEERFTIENNLAQLIEETHFTYYSDPLFRLKNKPCKKENSIKASL